MIRRERKTRSAILKGSVNAGNTLDMKVNFLSVCYKDCTPDGLKHRSDRAVIYGLPKADFSKSVRLSAADEVNHLQPIAFAEHCLCPFVPANDFTVEFDCDSRRRQ